MVGEEEILKNRAGIKMNETRIKAIINLLGKEGILTHEEVEDETKRLIAEEDEGNSEE